MRPRAASLGALRRSSARSFVERSTRTPPAPARIERRCGHRARLRPGTATARSTGAHARRGQRWTARRSACFEGHHRCRVNLPCDSAASLAHADHSQSKASTQPLQRRRRARRLIRGNESSDVHDKRLFPIRCVSILRGCPPSTRRFDAQFRRLARDDALLSRTPTANTQSASNHTDAAHTRARSQRGTVGRKRAACAERAAAPLSTAPEHRNGSGARGSGESGARLSSVHPCCCASQSLSVIAVRSIHRAHWQRARLRNRTAGAARSLEWGLLCHTVTHPNPRR